VRAALLCAALLGCGAVQMPPADRALCYAAADVRAQARVDAECKGVVFAVCPAHDSILAQMQSEQEACK
jgi:hypothetical protein